MLLYRLLFESETKGTEALFYRHTGGCKRAGAGLALADGATVSFDTYFNSFSHAQYRKYCALASVYLSLRGSGRFRLEIFHRSLKNKVTPVKSATFEGSTREEIPLSSLPADGYLFFTLTALGEARLLSGGYESERVPAPVKVGIVICTFRREGFVKANLQRMLAGLERAPELRERLHIFIADNARTLDLPASDAYTVLPNPNLGGSGGFTRGIEEVCKDASFTHFLLMDDDISFEFETIERTLALLASLSPAYSGCTVGGAMLYLDRPTVQHEFGGYFSGIRFRQRNSLLDVSDPKNLLKNEAPKVPANYNAWWYCCMPAATVQKYGLPMPFFIKGDDVEYGLRCTRQLIVMNGIAVWHQDFSYKYNAALEYYGHRNFAIVSAMHFHNSSLLLAYHLVYAVFSQLTQKRYFCAELILQAYRDFFRGCAFLRDTDMEQLNAEVMQCTPQYLTDAQLNEALGTQIEDFSAPLHGKPHKKNILRKFLLASENFLPAFLFSRRAAIADANRNTAQAVFLHRTAVHYDRTRKAGYICKLDTARRRKIRRETYKLFFKLLFGFGKMRREYRERYGIACSEQAWQKKFDQ